MKIMRISSVIVVAVLFLFSCTSTTNKKEKSSEVMPVNANATKEAKALLNFIYDIHGKYVISGQHNYLGKMSVYGDSIEKITGKYPAIWGSDYGFSDSTNDIDNIAYRPLLVPEIVKQHKRGCIITVTYHQASPAVEEPCPWIGGVQTKLTDEQWNDVITDGTELNTNWKVSMDRLANEFKALQDKNIPVLFRPYHEMNGGWFWWGKREGEKGFAALWQMLYHYYTDYHKLNNLIWVWSPDKSWHGLTEYYPGDEFVDIVTQDIYPEPDTALVFRQEWHDDIKKIAGTRPYAVGECSTMPTLAEYETRNYAWFMLWSDLGYTYNTPEQLKEVFNSEKCLTADEILEMRTW